MEFLNFFWFEWKYLYYVTFLNTIYIIVIQIISLQCSIKKKITLFNMIFSLLISFSFVILFLFANTQKFYFAEINNYFTFRTFLYFSLLFLKLWEIYSQRCSKFIWSFCKIITSHSEMKEIFFSYCSLYDYLSLGIYCYHVLLNSLAVHF